MNGRDVQSVKHALKRIILKAISKKFIKNKMIIDDELQRAEEEGGWLHRRHKKGVVRKKPRAKDADPRGTSRSEASLRAKELRRQ